MPLLLSSCNGGYDTQKPIAGTELSEAEITLANGSKTTIKKDMSKEESFAIFSSLKEIDLSKTNSDSKMSFKLDNQTYEANGKIRYTSNGEKRGYYYQRESGSTIYVMGSTGPEAVAYNSFSYAKEGTKYLSFYGRVPSERVMESINSQREEPILFADPDYDSGSYTKDDLPLLPPAGIDSKGLVNCYRIDCLMRGMYPCCSISHLIVSYKYGDYQLDTDVSFKITKKYLILNISNPYGLLEGSQIPGVDRDVLYAGAVSASCYLKAEVYYNLESGDLAYCEADFKTNNFAPGYRNILIEGSFVLKTKEQSDEGYKLYNDLRKKIVKESNHFEAEK